MLFWLDVKAFDSVSCLVSDRNKTGLCVVLYHVIFLGKLSQYIDKYDMRRTSHNM